MNRKPMVSVAFVSAVLGASSIGLFGCFQDSGRYGKPLSDNSTIQQDSSIKYKVGRVIRSSNAPHETTVIISVDPTNFVRDTMVKLAHKLREDFPDEPLLRVEILDDQNIADHYIPAGDMYQLFNKAKRGTYVLNRNTREERIQFSTARGKRTNQIKIDLTKSN